MHLYSNIRFLRQTDNMTLPEFGKIINKGGTAISNYEAGIRDMKLEDIFLIADFFHIPAVDLITKDLRFENIDTSLDLEMNSKFRKLNDDKKKAIINIIDNMR